MPISFQCTNCQSVYNVQGKMAGKRVRCKCGAELIVPPPVAPAPPVAKPVATPSNAPSPTPSGGIDDLLGEQFPSPAEADLSGIDPLAAGPELPRRRPRKSAKSANAGLWIGLVVGAVALGLLVIVALTFWDRGDNRNNESPVARTIPQLAESNAPANTVPADSGAAIVQEQAAAENGLQHEQPKPRPSAKGYATPEEAVKAFFTAGWQLEFGVWWDALSPRGQEAMLRQMVERAVWYADHKKDFGDRGDYVQPVVLKHGIKPLDASEEVRDQREAERVAEAMASLSNPRKFIADFQKAISKQKGTESDLELLRIASLKGSLRVLIGDVEVSGDRAQVAFAANRGRRDHGYIPVGCVRIDGRWFLDNPSEN
jgi:hypothetical protein